MATFTETIPDRKTSGKFDAEALRVEDEYFAALEKKNFPNFSTPFLHEGKLYTPINRAKGIICMESRTGDEVLIMHTEFAREYLDDESEFSLHAVNSCFK